MTSILLQLYKIGCKRIFFVPNLLIFGEQNRNKIGTKIEQRCDTHVRTYYIARTYLENRYRNRKRIKKKKCACVLVTRTFFLRKVTFCNPDS